MSSKGACKAVGLSGMERIIKHEGQYFDIILASQPYGVREGREVRGEGLELALKLPSDAKALFGRFAKVLDEPKNLPTSRDFDHHIIFKDKAKLMNVAPYRVLTMQRQMK